MDLIAIGRAIGFWFQAHPIMFILAWLAFAIAMGYLSTVLEYNQAGKRAGKRSRK